MNVRCMLLLVLSGSLTAGCQNANQELVERELRLQEDRIYQLEDELDRHCKALQACRAENQTLKAAKVSAAADKAAGRRDGAATSSGDVPGGLTPPKVEIEMPELPGPASSPSDGLPSLRSPANGDDGEAPQPLPDLPVPTPIPDASDQGAVPNGVSRIRVVVGDEPSSALGNDQRIVPAGGEVPGSDGSGSLEASTANPATDSGPALIQPAVEPAAAVAVPTATLTAPQPERPQIDAAPARSLPPPHASRRPKWSPYR